MPHLTGEGIITEGKRKIPMVNLLHLSTHGNGIAISNQHLGQGIGLDVSQVADYIKGFQATASQPFTAAYTFPQVNQDFWIRYWLAAGSIDPDKDIIVHPSSMHNLLIHYWLASGGIDPERDVSLPLPKW